MKKVLISLFVMLLCSCEEGNRVWVYKNRELDMVRHLEVPFSSISHFEYRGHSYIKFSSGVEAGAGVVHDPDCKCKEEN